MLFAAVTHLKQKNDFVHCTLYGPLQYSAVEYRTVRCSEVLYITEHYSAEQWGPDCGLDAQIKTAQLCSASIYAPR